MAPKAPIPGVLFVNSDVINTNKLSRDDFNSWYCDDHIPDVVRQSGVTHAYRYEHVIDGPSPDRKLKFLTLYNLPDLNHMETAEFGSLEGQSPGPNLETIFKHSEFDTRAYETVQVDERKGALGPAPFLLYAAIKHSSPAALEDWYQGEHVPEIAKCPNYRRTSRYKLKSRSVLSAFERLQPNDDLPALALHEFEGPDVPWEALAATDATAWAKKVVPGITGMDFGLFKLTRVFKKEGKAKL